MKYIGTLIIVNDCKKSLEFYRDIFGFELVRDNDGNVDLTNGLFLQEAKY